MGTVPRGMRFAAGPVRRGGRYLGVSRAAAVLVRTGTQTVNKTHRNCSHRRPKPRCPRHPLPYCSAADEALGSGEGLETMYARGDCQTTRRQPVRRGTESPY